MRRVDDQIARYPEKNQDIHAGVKHDRRQNLGRETARGRGGKQLLSTQPNCTNILTK